MSIHEEIKRARERLGWSMERLAKEVSEAEGLPKPLTWQTVQQWENGTSAPKRTRMQIVRRLLKLDAHDAAAQGQASETLAVEELELVLNYRKLLAKDRTKFGQEIAAAAQERQAEAEEILARFRLAQGNEVQAQGSQPAATEQSSALPLTPEEQARIDALMKDGGTARPIERKKSS